VPQDSLLHNKLKKYYAKFRPTSMTHFRQNRTRAYAYKPPSEREVSDSLEWKHAQSRDQWSTAGANTRCDGASEVFANAPGYRVEVAAPDGSRALETNRGISLSGTIPLQDISGPIDTLVIAGEPGAESGVYDKAYLEWIEAAAAKSRRVASICTGAFLLAAAGLGDGKRAGPIGTSAIV
jgi:DJ-1/PfpI family